MNLRTVGFALLFCLAVSAPLLSPPTLFAQGPTDEKPSAPAPDLFAEFETVVSVEHLTPHLLAILNDPQLVYGAGAGTLAGGLNRLRTMVESFAGGGPSRVEFGMDDGAQHTLCTAIQVGLALTTPTFSVANPSATNKESLSTLHSYVDDLPTQARLSLVVSGLHEREIASMRESMTEWRELAGPAITATETEIRLDIQKAVELFSLPTLLADRLAKFRATPEQIERAKTWLGGLKGEARMLTGDTWARADVFVGEKPAEASHPNRGALLKQLDANAPEVLCRLKSSAFKESWRTLKAAVATWKKVGLWDSNNLLFALLAPGFDAVSSTVSRFPNDARACIDFGQTTRAVSLNSTGENKWVELRTSDLTRCIPSDAKYFGVNATQSLLNSSFFVGLFEGFTESFAKSSPLTEVAKRTTAQAISELNAAFDTGWGWVAEVPQPTAVQAQLGPLSADWKQMPIPPMALFFRTHDPKANLNMIRTALAKFSAENRFMQSNTPLFIEKEVGLDVPTWAFNFDFPVKYTLEFEAQPPTLLHTFRVGPIQVISTSPKLSQQILEAAKRPLPSADGTSVTVGHVQGPFAWATHVASDALKWLVSDDSAIEGDPRLQAGRKELIESLREFEPLLELASRIQTTRTRVLEGSTVRMTNVITVAPAPEPAISKLKPSAQKKIFVEKGLERLFACQQEDGRFVDPDAEGLSDLALTALCILTLEEAGFDLRTRDRIKNAIAWLSQQQVTEGRYRGFIGDPKDDSAWEHQGMIITSLLPRFSPMTPEHQVHERLIEFLTKSKFDREWSLEQAYWWAEVSSRKDAFERTLHLETETEYALEDALDQLQARAEEVVTAPGDSAPISAIALEQSRFDFDGGYAKLAKANVHRFFPELVKEAPRVTSPWELRAIGLLAQGSRKLSYAWIEAIASQKYRDDSLGSWPHLPPPYHTEVSATAAALLILDEFGDEQDFKFHAEQRERLPDMYPDLDE